MTSRDLGPQGLEERLHLCTPFALRYFVTVSKGWGPAVRRRCFWRFAVAVGEGADLFML